MQRKSARILAREAALPTEGTMSTRLSGWVTTGPISGMIGIFVSMLGFAQSIDIGSILSTATLVLTGICAGTAYFLKNTWPLITDAIFNFLQRRDEVRSKSLGGKISELTDALTVTTKRAEQEKGQNDRLEAMLKLANEQAAELKDGMDRANVKLHDMLNNEHAKLMQHELEKKQLQATADDAMAKLNRQINSLKEQLARSTGDISAKVDQASAKVDRNHEEIRAGVATAGAGGVATAGGATAGGPGGSVVMPSPVA